MDLPLAAYLTIIVTAERRVDAARATAPKVTAQSLGPSLASNA